MRDILFEIFCGECLFNWLVNDPENYTNIFEKLYSSNNRC